jgi:hypothetical protein
MVDLGVALTWLAFSAASAKGLSVLVRASATDDFEEEPSLGEIEDSHSPHARIRLRTIHPSSLLSDCS